MPKYVKWETVNKPQNEYNIGNKKISFGRQGISTVDIIVIIIASLAIILAGVFLYKNIIAINTVTEEIDAMKITVESKQDTIIKLTELGNDEQQLKDDYNENLLYIPNTKNTEDVMSDVDEMINISSVKFINLKYGSESEIDNGVVDMPFTLKVEGTYDQVNELLDLFSKTERLYVVDSVNSIKTDSVSELISSEILIHAYYKAN